MGYTYTKKLLIVFCNSYLIGHLVFHFAKFDTLGGYTLWQKLEMNGTI